MTHVKYFSMCVIFLGLSGQAHATDFYNKTVGTIRGPDSRPCTLFTLNGVPSSNPATGSTSSWFALRQSSTGYKENLALLMGAKLAGAQVNVATLDAPAASCGEVEVSVVMQP